MTYTQHPGVPDAALRYQQRGYTLTELLMAVAISSVLLGIGVPSMAGLIRDARLSTQADSLAVALNLARSEAVKRRSNIVVCPSAQPHAATGCSTDAADWSKGWLIMNGATVGQRAEVKSGLAVTSSATSVTFNGTLGSANSATSITLCTAGRKQQVVSVSPSGHISKSIGPDTCV